MAKKKIILESELITKGAKKAAGEINSVNKATKNLTSEQSKLNRNLRGTAQSANRAGKDFSRMSQGMGGLVQQYATVVANVYALSAAFNVLSRAADLSSMLKSAENYSNKFGISVSNLTKSIQKATGGAFDLAEALPSINKAIATGLSVEKIEKLAIAATKASQTFGGSASEALNRFISAAQRGRVEIIQTLGIVIKTDQVYAEYAASIGKTVKTLSAFDKQQAIVNATIAESENVLGAIVIDPNPFKQFLTTLVDVKNTILTFATDGLTPILNFFNKSKVAAYALIGVLTAFVGKKIFPQFGVYIKKAQQESIIASQNAARKTVAVKRLQTKLLLEEDKKVAGMSMKNLAKRSAMFEAVYKKELAQYKTYTNQKLIIDGKYNLAAASARRTLLSKELKMRDAGATKGLLKAYSGIKTKILRNEYNRLTAALEGVNAAAIKVNAAMRVTNVTFTHGALTVSTYASKIGVLTASMNSLIKSSFAQGVSAWSKGFVAAARFIGKSWQRVFTSINTGSITSALALKALSRTVGVVVTGFAALASSLLNIFAIGSIIYLIWDTYKDKLMGVSEAHRAFKDQIEESGKTINDNKNRILKFIKDVEKQGVNGFKQTGEAVQFLTGTLDEFLAEYTKMQEKAAAATGGFGLVGVIAREKELNKERLNIQSRYEEARIDLIKKRQAAQKTLSGEDPAFLRGARKAAKDTLITIEKELAAIDEKLAKLPNSVKEETQATLMVLSDWGPQAIKAFNVSGFTKIGDDLSQGIENAFDPNKLNVSPNAVKTLKQAFLKGGLEFEAAIDKLNISEQTKTQLLLELEPFITSIGDKYPILVKLRADQTALADTEKRLSTYIEGLSKAAADATPEKESFGFLFDLNSQILSYAENMEKLQEAMVNLEPGQLDTIKAFLGLSNNADISELRTAVIKYYTEAEKRVQAITEALAKQKILQKELENINISLVDSYAAQYIQAQNAAAKNIDIAKNEAILAANRLKSAQALFNQVEQTSSEESWIYKKRLETLNLAKQDNEVAKTKLANVKRINAEERIGLLESAKIVSGILVNQNEINKLRLESAKAASYAADSAALSDRMNTLREEQQIQEDIRRIEQSIRKIKLETLALETENVQLKAHYLKLLSLEESTANRINAMQDSKDIAERIKLLEEELNKIKEHAKFMADIRVQASEFLLSITRGTEQYAELTENLQRVSKYQKLVRDQNIANLNIDRERVRINTRISEEDKKRILAQLDFQISLEKARNAELEYQADLLDRINTARANEPTLGGFLSPSNFKLIAESFGNEINKQFANLEPAILVFTRGLVNMVSSTVDTIIDTTMEYGFSKFGRTLRKELEAGFRQAVGDTLKNNIKGLIAGATQPLTEAAKTPQQKEAETGLKASIDALLERGQGKTEQEALNNLELQNNEYLRIIAEATSGLNTQVPSLLQNQITSGTSGTFDFTKGTKDFLSGNTQTAGVLQQQPGSGVLLPNYTMPQSSKDDDKISDGLKTLVETSAEGTTQLIATGNANSSTITETLKLGFYQTVAAIIQSAVSSYFAAANGGIIQGMGKTIPSYAAGGVTRGPEIALIGEGNNREAIVPLPNNKEIPVDLRNSQTGDTINISQNFDFRNADESAVVRLRQEARNIEDRTFNRVFSEISKGGRYAKISGRR